jgi:hypothetical protein
MALTLGSGACASLSIQVVEHGQYEPRAEARQLAAGSTSAGHVHEVDALRDPVLIAGSDRIVARRGARFGIKLWVKGSPSSKTVPVRVRVLHPPLTHPATGRVSDREEWDGRLNVGIPRFTGWSFDEDWEMAAGLWTIQVLYRGKVLAQQGFTVSVEPGSEPE